MSYYILRHFDMDLQDTVDWKVTGAHARLEDCAALHLPAHRDTPLSAVYLHPVTTLTHYRQTSTKYWQFAIQAIQGAQFYNCSLEQRLDSIKTITTRNG